MNIFSSSHLWLLRWVTSTFLKRPDSPWLPPWTCPREGLQSFLAYSVLKLSGASTIAYSPSELVTSQEQEALLIHI